MLSNRAHPQPFVYSLTIENYTLHSRYISSTAQRRNKEKKEKETFNSRLRTALRKTKIEWYPIPIGLGIGFLGFVQLYHSWYREKAREEEQRQNGADGRGDEEPRPQKRKRIRPSGPWQVQVMSTLPLKAISRLWGRFNELTIPPWLRDPGFRLYAWAFGVNLSEADEKDLRAYPNLAAFFYRSLKPGVRPLDPNPSSVVSPADGRVLQFGRIENGEVEQVKGMTYSLDALLGAPGISPNPFLPSNIFSKSPASDQRQTTAITDDQDVIKADEEFAVVNGISYSLPDLLSGDLSQTPATSMDASTIPKPSSESEVRAELAMKPSSWSLRPHPKTALYYIVIYLAPGDYHRFHSPTSWVVSARRHFAGELYSVSPYLQRTLPGLFTLNERVVLLGRWRHGFFSYVPVGATNVGSIKINFDKELRTNSLLTDTAADRAAEEALKRGEKWIGFSEAVYRNASKVLGGYALKRGEEMGGFQLGSTIVLVFEAPTGKEEGDSGKIKGGWNWNVEKGQRVKVGEAIGWVDEDS
ncbi:MAG: phosphatidylserine decarboxylase 1 [Cirrosporium novae-zelandiae]|nr:MAG: phosphatidylserine decarboxylase 1 [Cirrosporium novae-zelandiae]